MSDANVSIGAYVDAAAELLAVRLDAERHTAVAGVMTRLAAFAGDLTAFPMPDTLEVAGECTP